jgi:hypothetical protein
MNLLGWLRKINAKPPRQKTTFRPHLEHLEDRLTPTSFNTVTNAAISITPNFFGLNATETVTATVMQQGTNTPVTSGDVAFNVNNQTGTAALNGNGQATFSVTLPLFAVGVNQTLQVNYQGATVGSDTYNASTFLAPVYLNVDNQFLPAQITYGTPTSATSFQSSGGETDALNYFGFPLKFNYIDPGRIDNIKWGMLTLGSEYSIFFGVPPQLG